jgi:hypothetical protein
MSRANISKKRKFVADGVFFAELNQVMLHFCFRSTECVGGGDAAPAACGCPPRASTA